MSNCECVPQMGCAVKAPTNSNIQSILEDSQNNLNGCEGMVQSIITFIDGDNDTGKNPRETTCLTSQAVNIRDQSESIRDGLVHIVETLGVK